MTQQHDPTLLTMSAPTSEDVATNASASLEELDDEGLRDGRPLETLSLPRAEARRKLAEQLQTRFDLPEAAARAIARAVKDPADARLRLDFPVRRRFRGGRAWCLETEVWSPAMIPSMANPRAKGRHPYPAALGATRQPEEDPLRPVALRAIPENGSPVLEVLAKDQRHVKRTLKANETRVLERNDLRDQIAFDGVREHVLAFPTVVKHEDGTPSVAIMMTADGSSRTTAAHDLTGTDTFKALYEFPGDERAWRTHMAPIVAVQTQSVTTVTDNDLARHRVAAMPAYIVLKVEPAGAQPVTALDAYRALTGAIHVQPPKAWMPTATLDEKADVVLGALAAAGKITEEYRAYLEGGYTPEEAEACGYPPDLGTRTAHIVATIMGPAHRDIVNTGIRSLTGQSKVQPVHRAEAAAGLILRPISHLFKMDPDLNGARSILERTLVMQAFSKVSWSPPSQTVPPKLLLDRAIDEFSDNSPIGPSRVALATEALMWLVVSEVPAAAGGSSGERVFRRDRSTGEEDKRSGAAVMSRLLESVQGLNQLYRAVEAGREGKPIPYVRADLEVDRDARKQQIPLDNAKLRSMAQQETSADTGTGAGAGTDAPVPPLEQVRTHAKRLEMRVDEVKTALQSLEEVKTSTGGFFVKQHGVPKGFVKKSVQELNRILLRLDMHGERYEDDRTLGSTEETNP